MDTDMELFELRDRVSRLEERERILKALLLDAREEDDKYVSYRSAAVDAAIKAVYPGLLEGCSDV